MFKFLGEDWVYQLCLDCNGSSAVVITFLRADTQLFEMLNQRIELHFDILMCFQFISFILFAVPHQV